MANFIIGAGGTGMRLLESFVYQCAAGVYPNQEFHILSIDTDSENKNRKDLINIINWYNSIRGGEDPRNSGLFSAKIVSYHYVTKMPNNEVNDLDGIINRFTPSEQEDNHLLAQLLFNEGVRNFDLSHGYRAQTQLGSFHMYATIINTAKSIKEGNTNENDEIFGKFIDKLSNSDNNALIFLLGSVFGGTGASSVPILPLALEKSRKIIYNEENAPLTQKRFGAGIMTDYFTFKTPPNFNEVVAKATKFRENSQLALMFYSSEVRDLFKNLYIVGEHENPSIDHTKDDGKTAITGGSNQDNQHHYLELITTCSFYDFKNRRNNDMEMFFKSLKNGNEVELTFDSFINFPDINILEIGFANLIALYIAKKEYNDSINVFIKNVKNLPLENRDFSTEILDKFLDRFFTYYNNIYSSHKQSDQAKKLFDNNALINNKIGQIFIDKKQHFGKKLMGLRDAAHDSIIEFNAYPNEYNDINNSTYKFVNMFFDMYNSLSNLKNK